jgi:hypothetical protein
MLNQQEEIQQSEQRRLVFSPVLRSKNKPNECFCLTKTVFSPQVIEAATDLLRQHAQTIQHSTASKTLCPPACST